jgi:cupin fold WbuC family metalloprotein
MALLVFSDNGIVERIVPFGIDCDVLAVDLPAGLWHCMVALEPGCIFFETKPGPYAPFTDNEVPSWAPFEGSADVDRYLSALVEKARTFL